MDVRVEFIQRWQKKVSYVMGAGASTNGTVDWITGCSLVQITTEHFIMQLFVPKV
jgi:hypothetical protein